MDSIDGAKYDISSLQILETCHNGYLKVENNVLPFYFENIMLPDSFANEPASHGYALFKIKTKANLPQNSQVKNKAEIYFDYHLLIITNTAITTFMDNVSLENGLQKRTFKYYPNPVQAILAIESEKYRYGADVCEGVVFRDIQLLLFSPKFPSLRNSHVLLL